MEDTEHEGETAVLLENVHKSYGSGTSKQHVLHGINMVVPKASIYGLLGPSGCGKTTALRCAVGRLDVDSGSVTTLGKTPNSIGHGVPGPKIGYMPQELALYMEMTIGETLTFFGRLHKMPNKYIQQRIEFLLNFLHLPAQSQTIAKLSGGQQRRTSFAISLLHEPELLILDEPTVGVDPLLRERIWCHLVELARDSHITIIITTHYIEEARQAHKVGLMRNGRLLAENTPDILIQTYRKQHLEDVFLSLCQKDQVGDVEQNDAQSLQAVKREDLGNNSVADSLGGDLINSTSSDQQLLLPQEEITDSVPWRTRLKDLVPSGWNILALCIKQLTLMRRNVGALIFEFLLPAFQIILFCLCVGITPFDLPVAVVNAEVPSGCSSAQPCNDSAALSCCYLSFIDTHTIIQVDFGSDLTRGLDSVKTGENWGAIELRHNFTTALIKRMTSNDPDNETLSDSDVHVYLDMTNQQIAITLQSEILRAMQKFTEFALTEAGLNPHKGQIPIQYEEPIYGEEKPSFTNFMAPGIILSITFFMATGLTALVFVLERKQGLLERTLVSGSSAVEVMLAHTCTQFLIMSGQVALLLICVLLIFKVTCEGPLVLVIILTLMQGLTGMALGLLISAVCTEEVSAIQAALGSVYPNMLLSGIIWPLEGMPHWLRTFSGCLPMTYAAQAMRCILARGWGITHPQVWRGFLVTLAWGWGLMIISAIIFKLKQH